MATVVIEMWVRAEVELGPDYTRADVRNEFQDVLEEAKPVAEGYSVTSWDVGETSA